MTRYTIELYFLALAGIATASVYIMGVGDTGAIFIPLSRDFFLLCGDVSTILTHRCTTGLEGYDTMQVGEIVVKVEQLEPYERDRLLKRIETKRCTLTDSSTSQAEQAECLGTVRDSPIFVMSVGQRSTNHASVTVCNSDLSDYICNNNVTRYTFCLFDYLSSSPNSSCFRVKLTPLAVGSSKLWWASNEDHRPGDVICVYRSGKLS